MYSIWVLDIYENRVEILVKSDDILLTRRIWNNLAAANCRMLSARP